MVFSHCNCLCLSRLFLWEWQSERTALRRAGSCSAARRSEADVAQMRTQERVSSEPSGTSFQLLQWVRFLCLQQVLQQLGDETSGGTIGPSKGLAQARAWSSPTQQCRLPCSSRAHYSCFPHRQLYLHGRLQGPTVCTNLEKWHVLVSTLSQPVSWWSTIESSLSSHHTAFLTLVILLGIS